MYYFSFSTGWPGQIVYATSKNPMGPFDYRGVILDYLEISTNHQAIIEHKGKSYLFYHDNLLPGGDSMRRSIAIEPLSYATDGSIKQVKLGKATPVAMVSCRIDHSSVRKYSPHVAPISIQSVTDWPFARFLLKVTVCGSLSFRSLR